MELLQYKYHDAYSAINKKMYWKLEKYNQYGEQQW